MVQHSRFPASGPPTAPERETTGRLMLRAWVIVVLLCVFGHAALFNLVGMTGAVIALGVVTIVTLAIWVPAISRARPWPLEWRRFPWAIFGYVALALVSVAWSRWPLGTVITGALLLSLTLHAIFIAHMLSWREILRAISSALKWLLGLSLAIEAWVAVVLRHPILPNFFDAPSGEVNAHWYWVRGNLLDGGRIQGIVGNANILAALCLVAIIVFGVLFAAGVRWRATLALWGVLAAYLMFRASSATMFAAAAAVAVTLVVALLIRRTTAPRRRAGIYVVLRGGPAALGPARRSPVLALDPCPFAHHDRPARAGARRVGTDHAVGVAAGRALLVQDQVGAVAGHRAERASARDRARRGPRQAGAMTGRRAEILRLVASAELARAYTLTVLTVAFGAFAIERVTGRETLVAMTATLAVIGVVILVARRHELSWLRFAPTSLYLFLLVALASLAWTTARTETSISWLWLLSIAFLAVVVGNVRDTLQTVRAIGDVLRMLLVVSLVLELLAGVFLDMPFPFLGIEGAIAEGGPIQGVFGTRNMLGFVAVIAIITFVIEWRSRSVPGGLAIFSVTLAGVLAILSASPMVVVLAVCVGIVAGALAIVRSTSAERRPFVQWTLGGLVVVAIALALLLRHPIIRLLDAGSDFSLRADLWNQILDFVAVRRLQGWGWFGDWAPAEFPFVTINRVLGDTHASALNAYFDVLLQLGIVGLVAFLALGGIAIVRSWLVASARRSVVYAWTPLVLVALAVESMFESFTIVGAGWFLLVLCALRAGQSTSWRESIDAVQTGVIPTLRPQGNVE